MPSVDIQIVSDLHLETPTWRPKYFDFYIGPECEHLALLGDIGVATDKRFFDFLEKQLGQFKVVFFVVGSQEAYGTTFAAARASLKDFEVEVEKRSDGGSIGRFVLLDRERYDLTKNITILGCTLFPHIPQASGDATPSIATSESDHVRHWTPTAQNEAHAGDVAWLNSQVTRIMQREPHRTIVVLTHYSPVSEEAAPHAARRADEGDDYTGVQSPPPPPQAAELTGEPCWTSPNVKLWAHGHTLHNHDYTDPLTRKRFLSNQLGFARSEVDAFDVGKVATIWNGYARGAGGTGSESIGGGSRTGTVRSRMQTSRLWGAEQEGCVSM